MLQEAIIFPTSAVTDTDCRKLLTSDTKHKTSNVYISYLLMYVPYSYSRKTWQVENLVNSSSKEFECLTSQLAM